MDGGGTVGRCFWRDCHGSWVWGRGLRDRTGEDLGKVGDGADLFKFFLGFL
jgi:hypothetical protein